MGGDVCDVVTLECAAGIRAEQLSIDSMDDYRSYIDDNPPELQELATAVVEARARLDADSLVPEAEVETVIDELEATIDALELADQERRATVDELRGVDHELTLAASELEVVTSQLDERTREVGRLNDFMQGILGVVDQPMIVVDGELVVRAWNEPAAAVLESSQKEAVGRPVGRLAPWFKTGPVAEALTGAVSGGGAGGGATVSPPGHPGVSVTITAIAAADHSVVGAIICMA